MRLSHFFIERPIFAGVLSVFITLIGLFAYPMLALSQFPDIAPPTVAVIATYPGASAETLAETVAAPLEQEINGVEDMIYMTSSSSNGTVQITVTFRPGTDLDSAQVLVQNRVNLAEPRLPEQVRQVGVIVNKQSTGFLMVVGLTAEEGSLDADYVGNYATSTLRERLLRVDGVGEVQVFGGGLYAMRIWIDPGKAAERNLTPNEIIAALRAQNVQAAGGTVGQPPFGPSVATELPVEVQGRLSTPEAFGDIVLRRDAEGRTIRLRDVARVEIGAQDYGVRGYFAGERGVAMAVLQQPGSNALSTAEGVIAALDALEPSFPSGLAYQIPYNPTEYVAASVEAVQSTLFEAVLLVVLVVVVFLHTWRAAIIPILAIPIALVGTFAVQLALGYSLNSLSLFALVLAVGIVVDDAIVVVENVERNIREGLSPREAAHKSMKEVSGALVAISLVLVAVFVPTAFVSGIPGMFYRQFAVTIAAATVISLLVSLTLSPALAALLLKPHREGDGAHGPRWMAPLTGAADRFNRGFDWLSDRFGRLTARLVRMTFIMLIAYGVLLVATGWRLTETPTGFIPEQDQGVLIGVVQLPPGTSLERTDAVVQRAAAEIGAMDGVQNIAAFVGLDGASFSNASNAATLFIRLDDWGDRGSELAAQNIAGMIMQRMGAIEEANIFVLSPPPVEGLGNAGGFKMMVQDTGGVGYVALEQAANQLAGAAAQNPKLVGVFGQFNTGAPRLAADVDRERALLLGVEPAEVFQTLGTYLGSTYVNDFNMLGRTFRVTAQAEPSGRSQVSDIANLKVRTASGGMAPLGTIATLRDDSGPARVVRFNLYPSAEILGGAAPGISSGEALAEMERLAAETLPTGVSFQWTELAYQEQAAGDTTLLVFAMAVVFVFLVLAAQYEAFTLPLAIILIVPLSILAAMLGVWMRGMDNNILTQVGLIVLVAMAAKNAILIVEFAKQAEDQMGMTRFEAAVHAAKTRLRPILMTSFAFIFGVLPMAIASGPGQEMRQALGTSVVFGMIGVTLFGLIFTPVFYVVCRRLAERLPGRKVVTEPPPEPGLIPHQASETRP
ncbi:efflux RND transporter permease subunit [Phenylobacterium sp.]|jgi:hydrophobe/amphiphile efflux-1 (HAE1) family protein|uniref:efflux RND transporter permease subunit n=1 Tax=Phenylobacterium sp. TaxID=1871053 RepID=UPI000C8FD65F|nr:multidrug efflux RND transporter permease subunit [Phenylobacterium sp.]MAK81973.1 hydrophobe/amphiphile efflux-1 family RND transporter [Phenylobacterium sp.]|tara:strand:+ start:50302 stop:53505 length:3204 start_codon:yes stop_codon:yes gene_type:complete